MKSEGIEKFVGFLVRWDNEESFRSLKSKTGISLSVWNSWDRCFAAFHSARMKRKISEEDCDNLCLHITAYLASWGMYWGPSFLKEFNYRIHENCVRIVLDKKFKCLVGISLNDFDDEKIDLFEELYSRILMQAYGGNKPSDTLVTKILSGTIACIPAYDKYIKKVLKEFGMSYSLMVNAETRIKALKQLRDFLVALIDDENVKRIMGNIRKIAEYPDMKIFDMLFVTYGRYLETSIRKRVTHFSYIT